MKDDWLIFKEIKNIRIFYSKKKWFSLKVKRMKEKGNLNYPKNLDFVLSQFYGKSRKRNRKQYEPASLTEMQGSSYCYVIEKNYVNSIFSDIIKYLKNGLLTL